MKRLFFLILVSVIVNASSIAQQFLPVKGIVNARDLGGYIMQDGRMVRDGLLLRSAVLDQATDSDLVYLSSIPVLKVIDFRKAEEKIGRDDRIVPGSEYIALPIDASGNVKAEATEAERKKMSRNGKKFDVKKIIVFAAFNEKAKRVAQEMYPTLLFDTVCQSQFAEFFSTVLSADSGAVLYHCTQGKDRTGVASALLLAALGADRATIVADFDATNKIYEKDVKKYSRRVRFFGGKEAEVAVVKSFLGCNTDNFIAALDRIDSEYGSLEAYLKGPMRLTDADINTLKARYLK